MTFPQTRHSLIQRIAVQGDESSWRAFLADYWGPVCRFARRRGRLTADDAEDVAAQTFLALVQNRLLARWVAQRSAKLRTLLCGVVRNVLANDARVRDGRARLVREHGGRLDDRPGLPVVSSPEAPAEPVDAFYAAWAEELLQQAVESLLADYQREARGDTFRVLYGRLCDGMTAAEVADALGMTPAQSENAYKHARKRLARRLEELVRDHVRRYGSGEDEEGEFRAEWGQLGDFLAGQGGLDGAVRHAYAEMEPADPQRRASSLESALTRLTDHLRRPAPP